MKDNPHSLLPELERTVQKDIDSYLRHGLSFSSKYFQMVQGLLRSWEDVREVELQGKQDYMSRSFPFSTLFHKLYK